MSNTVTVPAATLRNNLAQVLKDVVKNKKTMIITNKGKEVAGIVDLDLLEDLEALRSQKFVKSIKKARSQYKKGQYKTFEEVFGEI